MRPLAHIILLGIAVSVTEIHHICSSKAHAFTPIPRWAQPSTESFVGLSLLQNVISLPSLLQAGLCLFVSKSENGNCGVSITRSGEAMEQGLRDCCRSIRIGKILIQSDEETQRAKVYYAKFPPDIYRRKVLLMYPILSTGNTVIEAVKVLVEHGVQPSVIILLSLFSTPHGKNSLLMTDVHPVLPTHSGQKYVRTD
uniref:Phosphoribosyltransferase domain-containing protein n=1 Tax=Amazona collaria TaxID=241587 RepID=A0A8B9FM87_9PSIT